MVDRNDPRLEKLEADVGRLADDLARLFDEGQGEGRQRLRNAKDRAREKSEYAWRMAKQRGHEMDEWAHGHVWTTAAIAAAVGMVMGMMSSRSRHSR